ncbi:hypothetical protein BKA62DRAFT_717949 [Auriculariales sp. MPI-PUGE-AT-0066]|nr:hypothetical protein BKA62DRAFT_717949 [Auriculariales sp. MPI-PUGE-AT-0066]
MAPQLVAQTNTQDYDATELGMDQSVDGSSGNVPAGSIAVVCTLVGLVFVIALGASWLRRIQKLRRRAAQVRRTRLITEREMRALKTTSVGTATSILSAATDDDVPLKLLQHKFSIMKPALPLNKFVITLDPPFELDESDASQPPAAPAIAGIISTTHMTPPLRQIDGSLATPNGTPVSTTSGRKRFSFATSVISATSWTQVARTLLQPSYSGSSIGSPRSAKFDPTKLAGPTTPKSCSKRCSLASSALTPSPGLSVLMKSSASDFMMLTQDALPPPMLTVTIPTMSSLSEQARQEYTMEQQILGILWDETESIASGDVVYEDAVEDSPVLDMHDECDVVDSLQVPYVY